MKLQTIGAALLGVLLLASPAAAQRGSSGGPERSRAAAAPRANSGASRGSAQWRDFQHREAPVRMAPHRFGQTIFPAPNTWRGNLRGFDAGLWQAGRWQHVSHGGRLGWWWVVGPDWYFYDAPVYPYPDVYTPPSQAFGWWYWCDPAQEYYPYVTYCPIPWQRVLPRE